MTFDTAKIDFLIEGVPRVFSCYEPENILNANFKFSIFIQHTPLLGLFSGRLHQVPKQPKLSLTIYIFTVFFLIIFPNYIS